MKVLNVINLLTIASIITASLSVGCGPYCVSCNPDGICLSCNKYSLIAGKCVQSRPLDENCELEGDFIFGNIVCNRCKPGYTLNVGKTMNTCTKSSIENCFYSLSVDEPEVCMACTGSLPDMEGQKCDTRTTLPPNCSVAYGNELDSGCFVCNEGYTVLNGECKVSTIKGCLMYVLTDTTSCDMCDYTRGFYAVNDSKTCSKQ